MINVSKLNLLVHHSKLNEDRRSGKQPLIHL